MPSLFNTDVVELAVKICNEDEFKRDIFSGTYSDHEKPRDCKESWDENVENRALNMLTTYNLEKNKQEAVIGVVFSISRRMLIWIEYHVGTFNFTRDFCIEFFECSLFTPDGVIDSQRVATKISGKTFSNLQHFQLASFYCQMERIPELFKNLSEEEKKLVYNANYPQLIRQPDIIKFWSYYYMGDIDKLKGGSVKIDQYRLEKAISSGSQLAVEYCLKMMSLKTKQSNVVDIAIEVIKHKIQREIRAMESNSSFVNDCVVFWKRKYKMMSLKTKQSNVVDIATEVLKIQREISAMESNSSFVNDCVVFRKRKYNCLEDNWAPDFFLVDIFYWLLSKMSDLQKSDMLWKLFITVKFETLNLKNSAYVKTLDLFLCWPYQDCFLELLKLSWNPLPKRTYGGIILEIINRIEPEMGHFWYGDDKICDYRKLLMEIWTASHASFKRYVFGDKKRLFRNQDEPQGSVVGKELLYRMFHLSCFTEDDRKNVISIIKSTTHDERIDFLFSIHGTLVCHTLIEKEKLDLFEELIALCFESSEEAQKFRKKFAFLKVKNAFLELVKNEKWNEGEEILKWGELTDKEMAVLKKDIISCNEGMQTCRELCLTKLNTAERLVHWCLPFEESIKEFKCSLLFSDEGISMCYNFLKEDVTHLVDKLVNWCLSSQDDIDEFKKILSLKTEISFNCLSDLEDIENCSAEEFQNRIVDWKSADTLLAWCFASESEVNSFKRKLLKNSKEAVILKCIELNKWDIADKFVYWLDLSPDKVKKMKKEIFFTSSCIIGLFDDYVTSDEKDQKFAHCGGKQQMIERFLYWFLADKESITEFTSRYKCYRSDRIIQNVINKLNQTII